MNSEKVLSFFKEITRIPRESGHEEKIIAYLQEFAASHNLECKTDEAGNVLIVKEAAPGYESYMRGYVMPQTPEGMRLSALHDLIREGF